MIHYYTNREISERLEINLARWKRWSRSFLPPDPLGGMQSGYARQYTFKDLFKVFLGGHLLSHLRLSLPDSRQVIADLSPWMKRRGFFELNGPNGTEVKMSNQDQPYHIFFCPSRSAVAKNGSRFGYLIRKWVYDQSEVSAGGRRRTETIEETILHSEVTDGWVLLQDPNVRMINLTALVDLLVEKLYA